MTVQPRANFTQFTVGRRSLKVNGTFFRDTYSPLADVVTVFFEMAVPAVIDGEQEFGRARDIHEVEYNVVLRACKASERRSRDACPVRALRSLYRKT